MSYLGHSLDEGSYRSRDAVIVLFSPRWLGQKKKDHLNEKDNMCFSEKLKYILLNSYWQKNICSCVLEQNFYIHARKSFTRISHTQDIPDNQIIKKSNITLYNPLKQI